MDVNMGRIMAVISPRYLYINVTIYVPSTHTERQNEYQRLKEKLTWLKSSKNAFFKVIFDAVEFDVISSMY